MNAGMYRLTIMGFSYCISAFMDCTIAAARAMGKSIIPMFIVIMGSCVFRVIWVYTVFAYFHTIPSLYLLYVFSWSITAVAEILYFIRILQTENGSPVVRQKSHFLRGVPGGACRSLYYAASVSAETETAGQRTGSR